MLRTLLVIVLVGFSSTALAKGADEACRETFDVRDECVSSVPPDPLTVSLHALSLVQTPRGVGLASASGAALLGVTGVALMGMAVGTFALATSVAGDQLLRKDIPDPQTRYWAARAPAAALAVAGFGVAVLAVIAVSAGVLIGSGVDVVGL